MTTHTDRELLELAAKAAGYLPYGIFGKGLLVVVGVGTVKQNAFPFDPFNDDSLALRLAVKLGMLVDCDEVLQEVEVVLVMRGHDDDYVRMSEKYGHDPYAATRRAIVRAAAEIGGIAP